ncbi:LysM peptidoglycan-binding domain-containing protein [Paenibacillus harenae]|uniref:LysM peptidoglycan-binding domain-containing protein n=1 Tax=Paenibacillus harenae TaxID=306543 RepID=UPI000429A0E0|nr:LysM domain-containing protein [Paenibacillus harenae]
MNFFCIIIVGNVRGINIRPGDLYPGLSAEPYVGGDTLYHIAQAYRVTIESISSK